MKLDEVAKNLREAKEHGFYGYVEVTIPGQNDTEFIINKPESLENKIEYYKKTYDDNGIHKHCSDIKIIDANAFRWGDMELKDTIQMMQSEDYKARFKAEYLQAKIRYDKLDEMTVCYEAGTLPFTPNCSLELLKEQKKHMGNYIRCLKIRAQIEDIDLRE